MIRKRFKIVIYALILSLLLVVASIVIIFFQRKHTEELTDQIASLQGEMSENKDTVYMATKDIGVGDKLIDVSEDSIKGNVQKQDIFSDNTINSDAYMTEDDLGKVALVNIKSNSVIQGTMLGSDDITKDTRIYECSVVNLTTDQLQNDENGNPNLSHYVDIRIIFPDGTDYIVLAKKKMYDLNGTIFNLRMTEDELLRFNSAMVDAATLGARLYTTRYVENTLQDSATPFYPVKQSTLDLISSDPNILSIAQETLSTQVRQDLEERMLMLKSQADNVTLDADFSSQINVSNTPNDAVETESADAGTNTTETTSETTSADTTK